MEACCGHSIQGTGKGYTTEENRTGGLDSIDDSLLGREEDAPTTGHDDGDGGLTELDALEDILIVSSTAKSTNHEKQYLEITVDSGAAEVVAPPHVRARLRGQSSPRITCGYQVPHGERPLCCQPRREASDTPHRDRRAQGDDIPARQRH